MNLQDLCFRFALLETDLFDIELDSSRKSRICPISLPRSNKTAEHLLFIKERLSCIHDELGLRESKPLSPKVSALLPLWCEKCAVTIDTLVQISNFQQQKDSEEMLKLGDETKNKIEEVKARCEFFQKELQQKRVQKVSAELPRESSAKGSVYAWMVGKIGKVVQGVGKLVESCLSKEAEKTIVWLSKAPQDEGKVVAEELRGLRIASGGLAALSLAATLSDYLVSYLEEHILHIDEREVGLRPVFLTTFFDDPYLPHPVPTVIGKAFIAALSSNKEDIKKMFEVNILIFLENLYLKMDDAFAKSPYALTSLIHATLSETIKEIQKDETNSLLDSMSLVQRNMLLSGKITKHLVEMVLMIGFPEGAGSLHIPLRSISFFGRGVLWNVIEEGVTSVIRDGLIDLSEHSDVQEELLLKGYQELNDYLVAPLPEEQEKRRKEKRKEQPIFVEFLVAIFSSFFSSLTSSFLNHDKKGNIEVKTLYRENEDLAQKIQTCISYLLPDTWIGTKLARYITPGIAGNMAPLIAEKLKDFGGKHCLNKGVEQLQASLQKNFPRTQEDIERMELQQQEERVARRRDLEEEKRKLKNNLPALAKKVVENYGFTMIAISEKELREKKFLERWCRKIDIFLRKVVNACFEKILLAFFRIIKLSKQVDSSVYKLQESVKKIPQDAFVVFMMDWLVSKPGMQNSSNHQSLLQK